LQAIMIFVMAISAPINLEPKVDLARVAVESCSKVREKNKESAVLIARKMLAVEKSMGVPDQFLGMSLAAACLESAFNPLAKGDKRGKKFKAIGVLQLWPWYKKAYGTTRTDIVSSTTSWLRHIMRMLPKVKKQCRYRSTKKIWVAAWVTGVRHKKPGGRCKEKPLHYKQLKKIRKAMKKQLQKPRQSDILPKVP